MKTDTLNPVELRTAGCKSPADALGPLGMAGFPNRRPSALPPAAPGTGALLQTLESNPHSLIPAWQRT
jgi:hypothetical protein